MTRWLFPLAILTSLNGCIIYETDEDCPGSECLDTTAAWEDTGAQASTEPEAPTATFRLTVAEGAPGEAMLTWIECDDIAFAFSTIEDIVFVGDVTLTELVLREDEAMLLVEVGSEAGPGQIEVILTLMDGSAVLLTGGFTVLDPADDGSGGSTGTNGGTTGDGSCNAGGDTGMGPC
jgi:hypothetical protein